MLVDAPHRLLIVTATCAACVVAVAVSTAELVPWAAGRAGPGASRLHRTQRPGSMPEGAGATRPACTDQASPDLSAAPANPGGQRASRPPFPYADIVRDVAARQGIDPMLVRAIIQVESAFEAQARSPQGAMGLMQITPNVAALYAVRDPFNPGANIEAGIRHLKALLSRFNRTLAVAAYNAGEAAVVHFGGVPPYPETRSFVTEVLRLADEPDAR
jgi:soluble lytic murein transglycosylase-like protein